MESLKIIIIFFNIKHNIVSKCLGPNYIIKNRNMYLVSAKFEKESQIVCSVFTLLLLIFEYYLVSFTVRHF